MLLGEINICAQATSTYVAVGKFYEQMMRLVQSRSWEPQLSQSFETSQLKRNTRSAPLAVRISDRGSD